MIAAGVVTVALVGERELVVVGARVGGRHLERSFSTGHGASATKRWPIAYAAAALRPRAPIFAHARAVSFRAAGAATPSADAIPSTGGPSPIIARIATSREVRPAGYEGRGRSRSRWA